MNWITTRILVASNGIYANTQLPDGDGGFIDFGVAHRKNIRLKKLILKEIKVS